MTPTGEPVGAEVRLLLSLAVGRIVAEAAAATASPAAVALRSVLEALQLLAGDGGIADAVESARARPGGPGVGDAGRRHPAYRVGRLAPAPCSVRPRRSPATTRPRCGSAPHTVTVVADLTTRSLTLDAPAAGGRFGWSAHASFDQR